jgi:hypothetical protein
MDIGYPIYWDTIHGASEVAGERSEHVVDEDFGLLRGYGHGGQ